MPDSVKLLLLIRKLVVRLPVVFGAKLTGKVMAAPAARSSGSAGNWDSANMVVAAAMLTLEIVAVLVPVFWTDMFSVPLEPTWIGGKITVPPSAIVTADPPLV